MTFAAGAMVAFPVTGGPLTDTIQPQPPIFGTVTVVNGGPTLASVLWQNGQLIADIPVGVLDEIVDADAAEVTRLRSKIVRRTTASSPEYDGVVIAQYKRDLASSGVPGPNLALVQSSANNFYYEVESSLLNPVNGR